MLNDILGISLQECSILSIISSQNEINSIKIVTNLIKIILKMMSKKELLLKC